MDEEQMRQEAIQGFMERVHYNPMWVDLEFLERCGLLERVATMLRTSGWPGLLNMFGGASREDTSEFLATLRYKGSRDDQGISYRFRGQPYTCSMARIRAAFGWPAGGQIYTPPLGRWHEAWHIISPSGYNGGNSSPKHFPDPALFYLHQVLSKTLFARKNHDKVGQLEMGVLIMLHERTTVHWGHYFCKHLVNLRANSPIACGGMVTHFLREVHDPDPVPGRMNLYGEKCDWLWFRHGRHVQRTPEGNYQWIYFHDETLRPPLPVRRPVGRPRGRGRGRGRALVINEPEEHEEEPVHQQEQPQLFGHELLDTLFNGTRASLFAGQPFRRLPAPPGWNFGDPIPPEYMHPYPPGH